MKTKKIKAKDIVSKKSKRHLSKSIRALKKADKHNELFLESLK